MLIWMLKKLSVRYSFDFLIFEKNLLWYFISAFLFSRLFYILSMWNDLKNMKNPLQFFIMSDYKFSLMGAIFGFFLVFAILLKIRKEKLDHFIS
jgi:prolipoprotein diacylglyceryltransferase